MSMMTIESGGVPFTVRIVRKRETGGNDRTPQYREAEPVVEFYDGRHKDEKRFTQYGQFVSSYYVSTLLKSADGDEHGLNLHGGVPAWQIDGAGMKTVRQWLADEIRRHS